jgi:FKBP-type peptidyl-prolyl cis-trans isomerase
MKKKIPSAILLTSLALMLTGCIESKSRNDNTNLSYTTDNTMSVNTTKTSTNNDKLEITSLKQGTGSAVVKSGDTISVHYVGTLLNGTKFDSSRDRGEAFEFQIGQGMVIQGWEEGLIGMKVGELRKLVIPASMGYGDYSPSSLIPANSTLVFEVELISIN